MKSIAFFALLIWSLNGVAGEIPESRPFERVNRDIFSCMMDLAQDFLDCIRPQTYSAPKLIDPWGTLSNVGPNYGGVIEFETMSATRTWKGLLQLNIEWIPTGNEKEVVLVCRPELARDGEAPKEFFQLYRRRKSTPYISLRFVDQVEACQRKLEPRQN